MATQDHTVDGTEITPAPWTLPDAVAARPSSRSTEPAPAGRSSTSSMPFH